MSLAAKLINGDSRWIRKSRLHDEKGTFVGIKNLALHGPLAVGSGLLRLVFDYRPILPWISYSAIKSLGTFLNKNSRVLEFGSGMSTVWFSIHAGEVCSVEDYRQWHDKVTGIFSQKGINNVIYKFAETASDYYTFMSDDAKGFDLIMVDGNWRSKCIMNAAKLLKPGGILYLDNSDKDSSPQGGDMRLAEQLAREFAQSKCAKITEFTDFAPTQLFVQQGIMIRT